MKAPLATATVPADCGARLAGTGFTERLVPRRADFSNAQRPSINDEPSLGAGPQAEASLAGIGSRTLADREGRLEGEAASADLPAISSPSQETATAAEAQDLPASAAFSHFTESCPCAATGQDKTAPELKTASSGPGAVTLSLELKPAVALILNLAVTAKGLPAAEIIARAICVYAEAIGIPSLARQIESDGGERHANTISDDFHEVPAFDRTGLNRFGKGR
ncbi:hypothetical protein NKJ13_08065 [Mesorhizobium sp. M0174]|uniref:hypothetical protein n=1 Tax=Mesorhizobium sp. M0174 TaxID=2956904 RepID=UPI00333A7431